MATLIKPDGTITEVFPAKGKKFKLEEMQSLVGGLVQHVPLFKRYREMADAHNPIIKANRACERYRLKELKQQLKDLKKNI